MEENLKYFVNNDCLICEDSHLLTQLIQKFDFDIIKFKEQYSSVPKIILNECEPVRFIAGFIAACRANCPVFLCNSAWGKQEWLQVFDLVKPDFIWGTEGQVVEAFSSLFHFHPFSYLETFHSSFFLDTSIKTKAAKINDSNSHSSIYYSPYIMIPTGGSSGKIKFAVHTWDTFAASVRGFKEYFQRDKINSFCVLPLYHVSGLMQFMRCFLTGGKLVILPFKLPL